MLYLFTGVMNDTQNPGIAIGGYPLEPWAHKYSTFKNQRKRAAVESLENIAEQLESVVIFANGLILTEAVRTEKTTVGKIVIDSLMISQMPKDIDWIEKIGLAKLNSSEIKGFEKKVVGMKPLKEMIDKEEGQFNVSVDLMAKLNPGALQSFSEKADLLLNLLKINTTSLGYLKRKKSPLTYLILLPYTTEVVTQLNNFSAIDDLNDVLQFLNRTNSISAHTLLEKSKETCRKYEVGSKEEENKKSLRICLSNLQSVAKTIKNPLRTLKEATMTFNFFIAAAHIVSNKEWSTTKSKIDEMTKVFDTIAHLLENIKNLKEDTQKGTTLKDIIEDQNSLKESGRELKSLKDLLDYFVPLAQTVDKMIDLYKTADVSQSTSSNKMNFLNDFKSYKCLPNGVGSFNNLKENDDVSEPLSLEYILSGISTRLPIIKEYGSIYNPIIQHSSGLKAVEGLSELTTQFMNNSELITTNITSEDIQKLTESIPDAINVKKALELVRTQYDDLAQVENWEKDLNDLMTKFDLDPREFDSLIGLFLVLPEYYNFVSKLQNPLFLELDINEAEPTNLESHFKDMKNIIAGLPIATQNAADMFNIINDNRRVLNVGINSLVKTIKSQSEKVKKINVMQLKPKANVNIRETIAKIKEASSLTEVFATISLKKTEIVDFAAEVRKLNPFLKLSKPITKEDVTSMTKLLEGMKNIEKRKKRSMTESYQIAKLMEGNPFGNDILDKIYKGMNDYRSIAKKVGSLKNVRGAIDRLKNGNEKLVADIKKFLQGDDVIEITPIEDVINVFDVIRKISSIDTSLERLEVWVKSRIDNDRKVIESRLKKLKSDDESKKQDISTILFFVSKINPSFAENISKLRKGFEMFEEKLTYVDCQKNPDVSKCHTLSMKDGNTTTGKKALLHTKTSEKSIGLITVIIIVSPFLIILLLVVIVIIICLRRSKKQIQPVKKDTVDKKLFSSLHNFRSDFGMYWKIEDIPHKFEYANQFEYLSIKTDDQDISPIFFNDMINFPEKALFAKNRVKLLSENEGIPSVHASYIQMQKSKWIVCQTPRRNTECNEAMFEMLVQENVKIIVQFCTNDEEFKKKVSYCTSGKYERYEIEKTKVIGIKEDMNNYVEHHKLHIIDKTKKLNVTIDHLLYYKWPYTRVPDDYDSLIKLMDRVQEMAKDGVVLVHSMHGIGRSMTFVSMVKMVDMLKNGEKVVIRDVVRDMRNQRAEAVENELQYGYLNVMMANVCAKKYPLEEKEVFDRLKHMFEEDKPELFKKADKQAKQGLTYQTPAFVKLGI